MMRKALSRLARALFPFGRGNITRLSLAYFFSTLYFYIPVGTLYLQSKGLDYVQINSLWGIIVGTMFLAEIPTGVIADRLGHKRAINVALGLQVLGEVIYIFSRGYGAFVLAAVVGGLGFAFASGCVEALVYDSLKVKAKERIGEGTGRSESGRPESGRPESGRPESGQQMTKAMGTIEAAQRLANLLAFALGGVLVSRLTQEKFVLAITVTACAVAVGFTISLTLRQPTVGPVGDPIAGQGDRTGARQGPAGGSLRLVSDGLRLLRDNRLFRRLVLLSLVTIPFRDYLGSLYQPRFVAAGVPPVWLGLSLSLASGLSVLGARYAYWLEERLGADWGLLVATGLPGVLYLAMAAVVHPGFTILVFCMLYGSMSLRGPILSGRLNAHIASENRATVLSLISMLSGLYVALVGLLFGRIADLSVSYALLAMGLVVLTGSLFFRVGRGDRVSPGEGDRFRSQCGGKHGTV